MKIAIIGTGGVGGYFGAKLVHAGFDVTFVARGPHLKAMRSKGLLVKSILGDFQVDKLKATDNILELENPDLIIIGVKAWQIKEIRADLKCITNANCMILPLQNGVLAAEELSEKINPQNVLGGLCRIISKIEAPGVINHFGVTPSIVFGELDKTTSERAMQLLNIFESAGIQAKISEDISAELWKKFIAICVSGLLAITKTTFGEIRALSETRHLMIDLMTEIYSLAQKIGINIEADFIQKTVSFIDSFPHDATSSLTRDIWEGRPSELEYQNGAVVRLAEKYRVSTPINKFVYQYLLPSELKAKGLMH